MRKGVVVPSVVCLVGILFSVVFADDIRVKDIPSRKNEVATVLGTIGARRDDPATSTRIYELADEWNDKILVRTDSEWPIKGLHYKVTGTVYYDDGWYLHEQERVRWDPDKNRPAEGGDTTGGAQGGSPGGETTSPQPPLPSSPPEPPIKPVVLVMVILTVVVFLAVLGVLLWVITKRGSRAGQTVMQQGGTMKLEVPTEAAVAKGTVKVLPGRFEVLEGESTLKEIRLWRAASNPSPEFKLARVDGSARVDANTVGFTHQSVSSNQGKIIYTSGAYTIINYADPTTKNPIVINGTALGINESKQLQDGDEITIGVVKLKYNAQA